MSGTRWTVTFVIARQKGDEPRHYQSYPIEVDPGEYVLDGIERIWAFQDRSLTFRHACHHSSCGACGMLVNGREYLTCITRIQDVTHDGGTLRIDPLRNFPVVSDLVIDPSQFFERMDQASFSQVSGTAEAYLPYEDEFRTPEEGGERLVDCIECGLCISACPPARTDSAYLGPAVLAAIHQGTLQGKDWLLQLADQAEGAWRCHSAYECTAVCPSNVDPAWRIMDLRRRIINRRLGSLFGKKEKRAA